MTALPRSVEDFIARWKASGANERANFQAFIVELIELLELEPVKVADAVGQNNDYRFERPVRFGPGGQQKSGSIDLYRKGCFVMEAKQGYDSPVDGASGQLSFLDTVVDPTLPQQRGHGRRGTSGFDHAMFKARNQGDSYARAVAREDGWPPFLVIVDVGSVIELYADFSGQGHGYNQFPDGNSYRIPLIGLRDEETRVLLKRIWTDPFSLDPTLEAAEVTRGIAVPLAALGRSLEDLGIDSEIVARFLMRCLFSMFAEDVALIPPGSFTGLLKRLRGHPEDAVPALKGLWEAMNTGGFSQGLMQSLKRFNGGLFREAEALPLSNLQLGLLIQAAEADWRQVEPAIFGTLLERALDKRQRHKLGAHYTPRAYVQRLITQTIMVPLREDWKIVQAAVQRRIEDRRADDALGLVKEFHRKLCDVRILDPACGSGNFLYVALEMMKRLEGEVIALILELGDTRPMITVDPHQFLGIELNPWAASVAELVLWIGYLQWHYRTHGRANPSEPVLQDFRNIRCADALLEWEDRTPRMDACGMPVMRWDGMTTMRHSVTGEEVPDPEARIQVYDYTNPVAAVWPRADFIVGNPPFIGAARLRDSLGDGYVEALWKAYPEMPQSADLVMFWWEKAALAARAYDAKKGKDTRRFGLITTNSLRQTFNRRVLERHLHDPKKPLSLLFAIPDHPWVDALDGAAVRIAMTVGAAGNRPGRLLTIATESEDKEKNEANGGGVTFDASAGKIFADLRIGANMTGAKALMANGGLSSPGIKLHGAGFIVTPEKAKNLGLGTIEGVERHIRDYRNGRDLTAHPRGVMVIDLFGLAEDEVKQRFPAIYQHLLDNVKPDRDLNNRETYRRNWWIHGEPRRDLRPVLNGLQRYIATVETTKHRVFQFLDASFLPDNMLITIGLDDAALLSVLSSRINVVWSLAAGGTLVDCPRYNHSVCFKPFPFPDLTNDQKTRLRAFGEELDAHRKRQQAAHTKLTLARMYNVLEKLRAGKVIEGRDREIYDQGLIGILRDLHDQIDATVAEAYGWPVDIGGEEVLSRLVALNRERTDEESRGHIRWLRPDYQNPKGLQGEVSHPEFDLGIVTKTEKAPWPNALPDQIAVVQEALVEMGQATPVQIARRFRHARTSSVQPLLDSLAALGQAERLESAADTVLYCAPC